MDPGRLPRRLIWAGLVDPSEISGDVHRLGPWTIRRGAGREWWVDEHDDGPFDPLGRGLFGVFFPNGAVSFGSGRFLDFVEIHRSRSDGTRLVLGPTGLSAVRHYWDGVRDGLWTEFGPSGRIIGQTVFLDDRSLDVRRTPRWYDIVAGLDPSQPIVHPITGGWVE